ncbi:hypothetical protein [Kribbella sp. NPDC004875]|uniref:hypothetical protein n=1 Tax=Kribbella sp. NPDC004875 TaxID=3364107 RepID=UPI0036C95211
MSEPSAAPRQKGRWFAGARGTKKLKATYALAQSEAKKFDRATRARASRFTPAELAVLAKAAVNAGVDQQRYGDLAQETGQRFTDRMRATEPRQQAPTRNPFRRIARAWNERRQVRQGTKNIKAAMALNLKDARKSDLGIRRAAGNNRNLSRVELAAAIKGQFQEALNPEVYGRQQQAPPGQVQGQGQQVQGQQGQGQQVQGQQVQGQGQQVQGQQAGQQQAVQGNERAQAIQRLIAAQQRMVSTVAEINQLSTEIQQMINADRNALDQQSADLAQANQQFNQAMAQQFQGQQPQQAQQPQQPEQGQQGQQPQQPDPDLHNVQFVAPVQPEATRPEAAQPEAAQPGAVQPEAGKGEAGPEEAAPEGAGGNPRESGGEVSADGEQAAEGTQPERAAQPELTEEQQKAAQAAATPERNERWTQRAADPEAAAENPARSQVDPQAQQQGQGDNTGQVQGDNATQVQGQGNNAAQVQGQGDNPAQVQGQGDNPAQVQGQGGNAAQVQGQGGNAAQVQTQGDNSAQVQGQGESTGEQQTGAAKDGADSMRLASSGVSGPKASDPKKAAETAQSAGEDTTTRQQPAQGASKTTRNGRE